MASDKELINTYTIQYQELIEAMEYLDRDFPNDVPGYNAFLKLAKKIRQRAVNVGASALDPLPKEK
jgi:hypothetical protein